MPSPIASIDLPGRRPHEQDDCINADERADRKHQRPQCRSVLREYRATLARPELVNRFAKLARPEVAVSLERLRYVGEFYRRTAVRFDVPRDPKDSPFIELAIAGRASHIITTDNDLLILSDAHDQTAKRFKKRLPHAGILTPEDFVMRHFGGLPRL
ncbi:MAG TPA: putative toxin-antitoxin system toxin component, PIN family [Tepidisphaeraceae bacterium]|nr:putative toxin-antitoxin system toxin component, PIN family [Tepidisphaeraceae bacterium]